LLEKRPDTERRIVVAFSDGSDSGSETQGNGVVRRATGSEVTIYGLGFSPMHALLAKRPELPPPSPLDTNVTRPLPPGSVPTPSASTNVYDAPIPAVDIMVATGEIILSTLASSRLEAYAGYTGGVFYSHWKKKVVEDQLSRIASEIHSQYELAYIPDTLAQPGFHRIKVLVRQPGVKVRARTGYYYQPPTP
jgi:VWFA-related protein